MAQTAQGAYQQYQDVLDHCDSQALRVQAEQGLEFLNTVFEYMKKTHEHLKNIPEGMRDAFLEQVQPWLANALVIVRGHSERLENAVQNYYLQPEGSASPRSTGDSVWYNPI